MRKITAVVLLIALFSQSIILVPAQTFTLNIWIDRGCGAEYHVGDKIKVYWEASHSCQIMLYEKMPDGTRRKVSTHGIISGAGQGSRGWTLKDYGYGRREIQASASSEYGSDSDTCEFYVVQEKPPDDDEDGVPDNQDNCYNPGCDDVNSDGCPEDSDDDGIDDCDDDCPYEEGVSSNDGCPIGDRDNDGVTDDRDSCYNPDCSKVDSRGCPKDSDGDGLNNCEDDCVSEYGDKDNNGCPPPTPSPTTPPTNSPTPAPTPTSALQYVLALGGLLGVGVIGVLLYLQRKKKEPPTNDRTYPRADDTRIYDQPSDKTRDYDDDTRIYDEPSDDTHTS